MTMRGDCAGNGECQSGPGGVALARLLGWAMAEIRRDQPHWARYA